MHRRVEVLRIVGHHAHVRHRGAGRLPRARGLEPRFVPSGFARGEAGAILAVALAGPLQRHGDGRARRRFHVRHHARVIQLHEARIDDVGGQRDRLPGLDAIGQRPCFQRVRDAVDEPPQQLPPETFVRLVLDPDRRVHLPDPRVLHRKRDRFAASVPFVGEHHTLAAAVVGGREQGGGARLDRFDQVHGAQRRHALPPVRRRLLGVAELRDRVCLPGARGMHLEVREGTAGLGPADDHRHHL